MPAPACHLVAECGTLGTMKTTQDMNAGRSENCDRQPAGLFRRLAAMFYDSLLLAAVLMAAGALALLVTRGQLDHHHPLYRAWLLGVSWLFFAWPWRHGGQTLGLRTWKLRVVRTDGRPLTWPDTLRRFLAAILSWLALGLGYWWILIDRDKRAWHDRLSETRVVRVASGE